MDIRIKGIVEEEPFKSTDGPRIGGLKIVPLFRSIESGSVTVAIADDSFSGDVDAQLGIRAYGEYSPGDPCELNVGNHDLLEVIGRYIGQEITIWIADKPINILD